MQNNYGSESIILENYDEKKRLKRARCYINPIEYQTYGGASKRENGTSALLIPRFINHRGGLGNSGG